MLMHESKFFVHNFKLKINLKHFSYGHLSDGTPDETRITIIRVRQITEQVEC